MPLKDPDKLREKQRRKRANRKARDPEGYARMQAERLVKLRAYKANPETVRKSRTVHRKAKAKASVDWRRAQQVAIAGREKPECCEVCGLEGRIVWDHCHTTDKFRGWICSGCNTALGHTYNSPTTLRKLADYLDAFETRTGETPTASRLREPRPRKPPYKRIERDWLLVDSYFYGSGKPNSLQ